MKTSLRTKIFYFITIFGILFISSSCSRLKIDKLYENEKELSINEVAFIFPEYGTYLLSLNDYQIPWNLGFPQYFEVESGQYDISVYFKDRRRNTRIKFYVDKPANLNFTAVSGHVYFLKSEIVLGKYWKPSIEDITNAPKGKWLLSKGISEDSKGIRYYHPKGK